MSNKLQSMQQDSVKPMGQSKRVPRYDTCQVFLPLEHENTRELPHKFRGSMEILPCGTSMLPTWNLPCQAPKKCMQDIYYFLPIYSRALSAPLSAKTVPGEPGKSLLQAVADVQKESQRRVTFELFYKLTEISKIMAVRHAKGQGGDQRGNRSIR